MTLHLAKPAKFTVEFPLKDLSVTEEICGSLCFSRIRRKVKGQGQLTGSHCVAHEHFKEDNLKEIKCNFSNH